MHGQMPQEIEVWYTIPALRREIAKALVSQDLSQKQIASIMGLTEAAVSQYLNSKRATEISFSRKIQQEIKKSAQIIAKRPASLMQEMLRLTKMEDVKHVTCKLHKHHDSNLPSNCETCFQPLIQIK